MKKSTLLALMPSILWLLLLQTAALAQNLDEVYITVEGEVEQPLKMNINELMRMTSKTVEVNDSDGETYSYTGVALHELLERAGTTLGRQLRGENLVKYVLATAADGYQVLYSLPEIDPEFTDHTPILAYHVNGKPLRQGIGPFRIVIPHEKRHARWIREVVSIKICFSKD